MVTPHSSVWRTVEDPINFSRELDREGIRVLLTGHRWRCLDADTLKCWNQSLGWVIGGICRRIARYFAINSGIGWTKEAESACESLTPNDVDVILTTGPPFAAFSLAKNLANRLGRPYVLDYRDPWVLNRESKFSAVQATEELERKLIEGAAAVTAVSNYSMLNGLELPKSHVISNGFDPDEMAKIKPYEFGHFAIVYAGNFYPPQRVITPVMQALQLLNERGQGIEWKFHYYGVHDEHVHKEALRFGITDKIVIHGSVPRAEALSAVRGSNVAVVITSVLEEKAEQDGAIVPGKLFESLGMRVPLLLIGPAGAVVDRIIETTGLTRKVTAKNIDGMVSFIKELMSGVAPRAKSPDDYAWPNIIRKLDAVLRNVIGQKLSH